MNILINILSLFLISPACYLAIKNMIDTDLNSRMQKKQIQKCLANLLLMILISFFLSRVLTSLLMEITVTIESEFIIIVIKNGFMVSICYIGIYIVLNIWNKRHARYEKMSNIWIFAVIFANEIAAVNCMIHMPVVEEEIPMIILQFLIDFGMFLVLYNLLEKEKIAKELEELHHYMEQEKLYYQEMDKQCETMAKLRHDYNNQLSSVLGLLHMKREDEAKELLKEMRYRHYD